MNKFVNKDLMYSIYYYDSKTVISQFIIKPFHYLTLLAVL